MLDIVSHRVSIGRYQCNTRNSRPSGKATSRQSDNHSLLPLLPILLYIITIAAFSMRFPAKHDYTVTGSSPLVLHSLHCNPITSHSPPQRPPPRWQQSLGNKALHILNGNQSSKGIKLAHWNLGSANLENKMRELEIAVSRVKPAVFGVSEANLHHTTDLALVQLPGYTLITANTLKNPKIHMSRVVVYLSEGMLGTVREDLMSDDFSSIWVELSVPGTAKKILVSNIYRDHQWMKQGLDKSSKSDFAVMAR